MAIVKNFDVDNIALNSYKYTNSCYLNYLFRQNYFFTIFEAQNIESISDLSCILENSNFKYFNWLQWYSSVCANSSNVLIYEMKNELETNYSLSVLAAKNNYSAQINNSTKITSIKVRPTIQTILSTNFNIAWLSLSPQKHPSSTQVQKYDVSEAFYWVSSICIAIVTISSLFIAWFYCWKRYRLSRGIISEGFENGNLTTANQISNLTNAICRSSTTRCQQRRNIYLLNARLAPHHRHLGNRPPSYSPRAHRNSQHGQENSNLPAPYFIALNSETQFSSGTENRLNNLDYNVINSVSQYNSRDDEPPNYYEAIKQNTRLFVKNNQRVAITIPIAQNSDGINDETSSNGQSTDV